VERESSVDIVVSSGEATVQVPDVMGQDAAAAEATLLQQGFEVIRQEQETCDVAANMVMDQTPDPGTEVDQGERVVITVAVEPPDGCGGGGQNGGGQNGGPG
jgi:serine/threonine-protein kinase